MHRAVHAPSGANGPCVPTANAAGAVSRAGIDFGALAPGWLDQVVIAATSRLPNNGLGLRVAIALRRLVMMRREGDFGLDVERWGLRMRLHPRHNGCEKNLLFTPQMYEIPERAELVSEIERAKGSGQTFVFVDIGANVGLFSHFVAAYAGRNTKILAIEPEPVNLSRLRFNVAANPDVPIEVIALALGENTGRVVLDVNHQDRGGTRTMPLDGHDQANSIFVECCPLFELIKRQRLERIHALKIDVEGAEDRILVPFFECAPEALWPDLIIIEDTRSLWRTDLFSLFAERGYGIDSQSRLNVMLRRR
jgi:FkbM family methyltransferase